MRPIYTLFVSLLAIQIYAQSPSDLFELEYEGEQVYAKTVVEDQYLGEYTLNKGKWNQHFFMKVDRHGSYLLSKSENGGSWDLNSRKEMDWGIICDKKGEPIVMKFQEFQDGSIQSYPAMIFVYKLNEEQDYSSKLLTLRNGKLFLDEAPKSDAMAAQ